MQIIFQTTRTISYFQVVDLDHTLRIPDTMRPGNSAADWMVKYQPVPTVPTNRQFSFWRATTNRSYGSIAVNNYSSMSPKTDWIRSDSETTVKVNRLRPNTNYIFSVGAVSKGGLGTSAVVFGRTMTSKENTNWVHSVEFLQWQSQHKQTANERPEAVCFTDMSMKFQGSPIIWDIQVGAVNFSLRI